MTDVHVHHEPRPSHDQRFLDLIAAAGTLATQADQAAVILGEPYEGMLRAPLEAVRAIISTCPAPVGTEWDGTVSDNDLQVTYYQTAQDRSGEARHVKIVHTITGIGRESYSKPTQQENYAVAHKSLMQAVEREFKSRQR